LKHGRDPVLGTVKCKTVAIWLAVDPFAPAYVIASAVEML